MKVHPSFSHILYLYLFVETRLFYNFLRYKYGVWQWGKKIEGGQFRNNGDATKRVRNPPLDATRGQDRAVGVRSLEGCSSKQRKMGIIFRVVVVDRVVKVERAESGQDTSLLRVSSDVGGSRQCTRGTTFSNAGICSFLRSSNYVHLANSGCGFL